MAHEELNLDRNDSLPIQEPTSTESTPSSDPILSNLLARFGMGEAYIAQGASLESLLSAMSSPTWQVRAAAAHKLGIMGKQETVEQLVGALKNDDVAAVRAAAARALGELDEYAPVEPLVAALSDSDADVRTAAAWGLGEMSEQLPQDAISALLGVSINDQDGYVRAATMHSLGELGERTPIERLVSALQDPEWLVREAAALTLGKQGDRAPIDALEAVLDDESEPVCKAAIRALEMIWEDTSSKLTRGSSDGGGLLGHSRPVLYTVTTEQNLASERRVRKDGNVEFNALEPSDLEGHVPVVAQAFDNQWIPRTLLRSMLKGKISYKDAEKYLEYLVRTEYIRSLITGEKLIINRAFIYNNPLLFRDYLPGQPNREAFKDLLGQGVIVPFFIDESSPIELPQVYDPHDIGFPAWQQLCQEVRTHCLRFSWENEENQQEAKRQLYGRFHEIVLKAETKDIKKFLEDLGLDSTQEKALADQLAKMADVSTNYFRKQGRKHIVRNVLYQEFVTVGNPLERHYDGTKPFAEGIKQLLDLAYNSNLADALGGYLLTPCDSPTRLILQEWEGVMREQKQLTAERLTAMLRRDTFQLMQKDLERLYLKSMGMLSLQDVQQIRNTDEWREYITSLRELLKQPLMFEVLGNDVFLKYIRLVQRMTHLIEQRNLQQGGALTAPWSPLVEVTITVGGVNLPVMWNKDGMFANIPDQKELPHILKTLRTTPRGDALCAIRLTIGGSGSSGSATHANLSSSIEIMKGRMPDARRQWEEVIRKLGEILTSQEFSDDQDKAPTINQHQHQLEMG